MSRMAGSAVTRASGTYWTLDQLAERVGAALSVDYDGQVSGRVREVPDQRAIRYYTTIGLVDRPAAMRGRTALYVRRHLLQLVAIKRLQADGLSLARIQRELAGATNAQLERVARIPPAEDPATAPVVTAVATPRRAFWKQADQPTAAALATDTPAPGAEARTSAARASAAPVPASAAPAAGVEALASAAPAPGAVAPVSALEAEAAGEVVAMQGVRLGDGVMLLVEGARRLGDGEVAAIREAARPLLDLVRRGRERS
jgi:DNA-binding transcriptional MerR regulator